MHWLRRVHQLLLVAATAASAPGCGDKGNCLAACFSLAVFDLSRPVAGQTFRVTVTGGTVTTVTCSLPPDAAPPPCDQIGSLTMRFSFTSDGNLSQVTLENPAAGPIEIVIEADGVVQVDQTFDYRPQSTYRVCGMTCYDSAQFVIQ